MIVRFTTDCAISTHHHESFYLKSFSWQGVLDTVLCDKVRQWHVTGRWFVQGTPVSSTNKTESHDITGMLLNVV